jgi:hypothetical protein
MSGLAIAGIASGFAPIRISGAVNALINRKVTCKRAIISFLPPGGTAESSPVPKFN